jgi:hypothetical protein
MQQVFAFGWPKAAIECYKFGRNISRVEGSCYLAPTQPGFYDLPKDDNVTQIDKVLKEDASGETLTVVITDLYQNDADLGTLFHVFKERIFSRNRVAGLIALKSSFDGTVYDIGLRRASRPWKGERPFYALVAGSKGDVLRYFSELSKGPNALPADRMVILSPDLLTGRLDWSTSRRIAPLGVAENPALFPIRSSFAYGALRIQQASGTARLGLRIEPGRESFHPTIDWGCLAASGVRAEVSSVLNNGGLQPVDIGFAARLEAPAKAQPQPIVRLEWNAARVLGGRTYAAHVRPVLDASCVRFPEFVTGWSASLAETSSAFKGDRTQNLHEFVSGLWRTAFDHFRPELGAYYIYFRK